MKYRTGKAVWLNKSCKRNLFVLEQNFIDYRYIVSIKIDVYVGSEWPQSIERVSYRWQFADVLYGETAEVGGKI